MTSHTLRCEAEQGVERLLVCDDCGRRIVVGPGLLTVIDPGDFQAGHSWSNVPGLAMTVEVA